jgi:uncharacterized protein YcaQ
LAEGAIFEQWAHAACFIPSEQFPHYYSRLVYGDRRWQSRADDFLKANAEMKAHVLGRIREEGGLRSADFERTDGRRGQGWWDWKKEKLVLEMLFNTGELMIARRQNFQRVYDLPERVRRGWPEPDLPTLEEARRALLVESVRALGVVPPRLALNYLFWIQAKAPLLKQLKEMVAAGDLQEVAVEGSKEPWLAVAGPLEVPRKPPGPARARLLSPFDPVIWDRERASLLFGFDYQIECYTPAPKRKFGYFSLPILHGDALVGRLDAKAHRKEGVFEVKALHFEESAIVDEGLLGALRDVLQECAAWHRTPEVKVTWADRPGVAEALTA